MFDAALAIGSLGGSLVLLSHGGGGASGSNDLDLLVVGMAAWSTVPLVLWRRFPLGVFVVTAAASVLVASFGYTATLMLGPILSLYLLAASRTRESPWTWRTTLTVGGSLVAYLGATAAAQTTFPAIEALHMGLASAVAWFAGERTRLGREQVEDLKERVRWVERVAERERQLAAAEERARIARDLHDSAGHAINVIAVRAGAARLRHEQDPERSLNALAVIEDVARQTAEEIDHIVGTLRDTKAVNAVVETPAGLASLETLLSQHSAAGLNVTFETSGSPRALGRAVDQAAYRILQEALTNATRHGSGRACIELAFGDDAIDIVVTNSVAANVPQRPEGERGGHGMIGMQERVSLLGGTLATRHSDGLFRLRARIPYREVRN